MTPKKVPPETVVPAQPGKKKICFFNSTPFWGGGEKWHLETALGFRDRGHRVVIAGHPGSPLIERARAEGLETAGFSISSTSALNLSLLWRLKRFFQSHELQTVVFNGPNDVKAGGLGAWLARVPQRVYRRGLALPVRDRWLNRYFFTNVLTHIVANSEETKRTLLQNLDGAVLPEAIRVIRNGIDLDEFDHRPFSPVFEPSEGVAVLGNVGRLTIQKGQSTLLDVARRLRDAGVSFRLLIAGEGELEEALRAKSEELDVQDHVEFIGFVEDIPSFLKGIDVFVLSSLWEGFGYVIVEAGAANKPVVAFDASSNPEVIRDGESGFLVAPGDIDAFAAHVRELIEDDALRARMGDSARTLVEERSCLQLQIDEFERYLWG